MHITSPHGKLRFLYPIYQKSGIEDLKYNRVTDTISHKVLYSRMRQEKTIEFISDKSSYSKIVGLSKNIRQRLRYTLPNFKKQTSPENIFHLYRRAKIDQAHFLARIGFTIDENYNIFLKYVPDIPILPSAIRTFITEPEPIFMPLNIWDGIISSNE